MWKRKRKPKPMKRELIKIEWSEEPRELIKIEWSEEPRELIKIEWK